MVAVAAVATEEERANPVRAAYLVSDATAAAAAKVRGEASSWAPRTLHQRCAPISSWPRGWQLHHRARGWRRRRLVPPKMKIVGRHAKMRSPFRGQLPRQAATKRQLLC